MPWLESDGDTHATKAADLMPKRTAEQGGVSIPHLDLANSGYFATRLTKSGPSLEEMCRKKPGY